MKAVFEGMGDIPEGAEERLSCAAPGQCHLDHIGLDGDVGRAVEGLGHNVELQDVLCQALVAQIQQAQRRQPS